MFLNSLFNHFFWWVRILFAFIEISPTPAITFLFHKFGRFFGMFSEFFTRQTPTSTDFFLNIFFINSDSW